MTDLIERASGDDPTIRQAALRMLGEHYASAPWVLRTLLRAVREDDNPLVRREALKTLGERFTQKEVCDAVIEGVKDPDWSVRETAVRLLGTHFSLDPRTRPLLSRLARGTDAQLRLVAGQTLSWLPDADPDQMPSLPRAG